MNSWVHPSRLPALSLARCLAFAWLASSMEAKPRLLPWLLLSDIMIYLRYGFAPSGTRQNGASMPSGLVSFFY
ncbi:MAG TPA: hypothetical protein VHB01_03185 [Nitrosospira sp.]|nr:hypothetical protein [Nitrosospira sp.]